MRIEKIGDATLYLGDCLEILPNISGVDLVLTDPPYKLESGGKPKVSLSGKLDNSVYSNDGSIVDCDIKFSEFMKPIFETMEKGHAYFMVNNRYVQEGLNEAQAAGFRFHNILVWDKTIGTPNRWYMKNCEFILFMFKGNAKKINDCGSKQLVECPIVLNSPHPTEKPVPLMEHYIRNSSDSGELVLDPFMGIGSTGVAALNLGRKFIGIEKDEKYFDVACERILKETNQLKMF